MTKKVIYQIERGELLDAHDVVQHTLSHMAALVLNEKSNMNEVTLRRFYEDGNEIYKIIVNHSNVGKARSDKKA